MKIVLKWSKTNQNRDKAHLLSLPCLMGSNLCPYKACRAVIKLYSPDSNHPLFQFPRGMSWMTDTRIRKCLSKLCIKMDYPSNYFTFHKFRRSGTTLAYNSHIPLQQIKQHRTWVSDSVWTYIQRD